MDKDSQTKLKVTELEKDVGVHFSTDLKFDAHIDYIVKKANQLVGIIKRSFSHLDKENFVNLYKTIIRPHLEYANVIWHPMLKRQKLAIEAVQRRATKIVPEMRNLSYPDRLKYLNLPSIKYRQLRGDLIQTYKIIHNIDNINSHDFFTLSTYESTRNSTLKLFKQHAKSNTRRNFLSYRVNSLWNALTETTRIAENLLMFKKGLDNELYEMKYIHYE